MKKLLCLVVALCCLWLVGCGGEPTEMPEGAIGGAESVVYAVDPFVIGLAAVVVLAAITIIAILVAKNKKR